MQVISKMLIFLYCIAICKFAVRRADQFTKEGALANTEVLVLSSVKLFLVYKVYRKCANIYNINIH
jgi:hypothetical protein